MELPKRIELLTLPLPWVRSTTELRQPKWCDVQYIFYVSLYQPHEDNSVSFGVIDDPLSVARNIDLYWFVKG